MNKEKKKSDPVLLLLDLIIIIMVFVIIAAGFDMYIYIDRTNRSGTHIQDAGLMAFELDNDDFDSLIEGKYINQINGYNKAESYHALADYVEALFDHKIYAAKGYEVRAKEQEIKMKKALDEMGELTVFAKKADQMFE